MDTKKRLSVGDLNKLLKHISDSWTKADDLNISEATRRNNISATHLGRKASDSTKKLLKEKRQLRIFSEETRTKMSNSHRGKKRSPQAVENLTRASKVNAIYHMKPISIDSVIYPSITEAVSKLGIKHTTISGRLYSTSKRFEQWKFVNKEEKKK